MTNEHIEKLKSELEDIVKKSSRDISELIASSIQRAIERTGYITKENTPHFEIMQLLGLIPYQYSYSQSNLRGDTFIFEPTQKARELYEKLKNSGYYGGG